MSAAKLQMDAGIAIAKKAMEDSAMSLEGLIDMVDAANASLSSDGMPHVIDTLA